MACPIDKADNVPTRNFWYAAAEKIISYLSREDLFHPLHTSNRPFDQFP